MAKGKELCEITRGRNLNADFEGLDSLCSERADKMSGTPENTGGLTFIFRALTLLPTIWMVRLKAR